MGTVTAPLTNRECVWSRGKVTHEYYEYEWERDSDGHRHREKHRRSDVIQDDKSDIPFAVDDGTGQAVVYPDDADIDSPVEVLDRMDKDKSDLMDVLSKAIGGDDTIGYRREEWIIPLDQRLFVQGEVTDEGGNLLLRKPEKGPFQVSTRSEQELVEEAQFGRKWASVGGGVLAVIGLGLVVAGLLA